MIALAWGKCCHQRSVQTREGLVGMSVNEVEGLSAPRQAHKLPRRHIIGIVRSPTREASHHDAVNLLHPGQAMAGVRGKDIDLHPRLGQPLGDGLHVGF
jgi:hypothetical protein